MRIRIYRRKGETPNWQAQAYVGGRRYRFSCLTDDKETAREYARQRIVELKARHDRGLVGLPEPVRMSQVFDRYEREALPRLRPGSAERATCIVNEARRWFVVGPLHDPHVGAITPAEIEAYLDCKARTGVTPRTVNLYRAILHRVFHLCVRPWLLIPNNPASAIERRREEPREVTVLTLPQYDALQASTERNRHLRLFITLAWETGARRGELLQLEWEDVDFERKLLTFANDPARGRNTKGRRSRTIPLSVAAVQALRDHAAHCRLMIPKSPRVFVGRSGALNPRNLYQSFKRAAKQIGLPTLRPHDLRHAFVTRKLAEGVAAQLVMRYVGHADLATTLRYTHLVPEQLRGVVGEKGYTGAEADRYQVRTR